MLWLDGALGPAAAPDSGLGLGLGAPGSAANAATMRLLGFPTAAKLCLPAYAGGSPGLGPDAAGGPPAGGDAGLAGAAGRFARASADGCRLVGSWPWPALASRSLLSSRRATVDGCASEPAQACVCTERLPVGEQAAGFRFQLLSRHAFFYSFSMRTQEATMYETHRAIIVLQHCSHIRSGHDRRAPVWLLLYG